MELIVLHCPILSMPSRIRMYANLKVIKLHNCTLVEWGPDAALTTQSNPVIDSLYFTMVNMSGIPDSLLAPDLPPTLFSVHMSATNLTELPMDLFSVAWRHVTVFVLERSPGISEFPRALLRSDANTWVLSLAGNNIQTLPEDLFTARLYYRLSLDRNPIQMLPENAGMVAAVSAGILSLDYTAIVGLPPSWFSASTLTMYSAMAATIGFELAARSTPLCENLLRQQQQMVDSGPSTSSTTMMQVEWTRVNCGGSSLTIDGYLYPLESKLAWRERNQY